MIPSIFREFFNCFTISTIVLDYKFSTIFTYNNTDLRASYYVTQAVELLKNYTFTPGNISFSIKNNINFTVIMFYHYDNKPMYLLLGPYILEDIPSNNIDSIPIIQKSWIDSIINLHSTFINNNICATKTTTTISPCINKAIEYIEKNYSNEISIDELCKMLNINKCYFCSTFKKETGSTFINYLNNYKIEKSKELLKNPTLSLLDISIAVGFNNQSYYSTVFKKITSQTPLEFRDNYLKFN